MGSTPSRQPRKFDYNPATRTAVPLLIGINSPSGGGKTYSALRLATGIQRVVGGDIAGVDTEANRMKHYAPNPGQKADPARGTFDFRHIPFGPPFSPLDYLDVLEHVVAKGARTIVLDSGSHMHDGPGGILEMHEAELQRMGGDLKNNFAAWAKPKAQLRQFINAVTTGLGRPDLALNLIVCFRAKDKLKIERGAKEAEKLGLQPIADPELRFEMTTNILLYNGAEGVPTWTSNLRGEMDVIKLPRQFKDMFGARAQLDEEMGEKMARWAVGGDAPTIAVNEKIAQITKAWLDWTTKRGVPVEQVLAKLGKASVDHIDTRDHETLSQLVNRVKAKELSVAAAFAVSTPPTDDDEPPADDRGDEPTPEEIAAAEAAKAKTNGSAAAPRGEG